VPRTALIWLALLALATAGCGSTTLSKKDLQKQAEWIQSLAAEGSLVAQQSAQDRTTETFVRVHTQYMDEAAKKIGKELDAKHASGSLERKRMAAVRLADSLSSELGRLHDAPGDRHLASELERELRQIADDAQRLAK
jgi:hypothetical protein